ncbi:MAG TPA: LytTR family DNA-binding domain-containing protein [Candidatus Aquilonibacter sp.]|jgi:two-component system LytT family response regulator|nr:LytTR family DNA-binding domain-containing protein [Candidatus Aquilonibacter sp.]
MIPDPVALPQEPVEALIRTIIADDERLARQKLMFLLDSEPHVKVTAECENGQQTVSAIRALRPDVLLLDIQMPDLNGFQVLAEITPDEMPVVIFTSAYDQYAIRAFEANALDYLLKPFDQERLHRAVEKARSELRKSRDREITHRIINLLSEMKPGKRPESNAEQANLEKRLAIKANGRVVFVDLDNVDWIEAAANYVRLNIGKESYLFRETITRVSERLDTNHFVRIHRSTIVNIHKIKELIPVNSGEYVVVLKSGRELSCSRGHRAALQEIVMKIS